MYLNDYSFPYGKDDCSTFGARKWIEASSILFEKISSQQEINKEDAYLLLDPQMPINLLLAEADRLTKKYHGNRIGMCCIYSVQTGCCSSDCAFCAQSVHNHCTINPASLYEVNLDHLINCLKAAEQQGVGWFGLVTSGEALNSSEFDSFLKLIGNIKAASNINLCASIGKLDHARAQRLKQAGINRYHHNIETSPTYFPRICSSHSFDEKVTTIQVAQQAGMEVCSGGIISLGESCHDRIDMALTLRSLDVVSVPINILNPIPGTRLEHQEIMEADEILKTIAAFRILLPTQTLRFAGGREAALSQREYEGFNAGINGLIAGNFLTTAGKSIACELEALCNLGLVIDRQL